MAAEVVELSKNQKNVFVKITDNDVLSLKSLISQSEFSVEFVDENGMTPLQHAAYKGNKEIVQVLLDQGADVNSSRHRHNYSALHFAALSGNEEVCMLLLNHGARSHALNSVNRTPCQMAAFVGNHGCVAVINNYIPKADVDYFTTPNGLEMQPKLEPFLAASFHKFIMQVNIHPIHVLMYLRHVSQLVENQDQVYKVLGMMSEREMKRGAEANEVLAFKFHWLGSVLFEMTLLTDAEKEKESDLVECCIKRLIRPNLQDQFVRLAVRRFSFTECTVFRQLVSAITGCSREGAPPGSLIHAINSAINGQRGFAADSQCSACGEEKASRRCSRCKNEIYCNSDCQKVHWSIHKKTCTPAKNGTQSKSESSPAVVDSVAQTIAQSLQVQ